MLTYLGDLGGLLDVLFVVGSILTSAVTSKLFIAALIGSTYSIQAYMRDFTQFNKKCKLYKLPADGSNSSSSSEDKGCKQLESINEEDDRPFEEDEEVKKKPSLASVAKLATQRAEEQKSPSKLLFNSVMNKDFSKQG